MTVELISSTLVTNADASPVVLNARGLAKGVVHVSTASVTVTNGKTAPSIYRFFRVPTGAIVHQLFVQCAALTSLTAEKFGVLKTTADGGGVLQTGSDAIWGTAQTLATAIGLSTNTTVPQDVVAGALSAADQVKAIWQLCGTYTQDPMIMCDIAMTSAHTAGAGGAILLKAYWSV